MSACAAAKYSLTSSILYDCLHGNVKKVGADGLSVLAMCEVQGHVYVSLDEIGVRITLLLVKVVVFDYLNGNGIENPFHGGVHGKDWWRHFKRRLLQIVSERKPQH